MDVKQADNIVLLEDMESLELDFIAANPAGQEIGYLEDVKIDIDIGDTNDFELTVAADVWSEEWYGYGNRVYIPGTEYGGIIEDLESITSSNSVVLRGYTWRGLLTQKVVEPPADAPNLILNGELNTALAQLVGDRFGGLIVVDQEDTGVALNNWSVDRYATLHDTIQKIVNAYGYRLQIRYLQGDSGIGQVHLQAVPVKDYSGELEYSQDAGVDFDIRDCRSGINHLICAGAGEGTEREILHLYVQEDGSIGTTQYYTGLAERAAYYDYGNAEGGAELEEGGRERLAELQNYKEFSMSVDNIDLEIGDIVGGREYITGTYISKPVIEKIYRLSDGKVSIEYELKGED